ncbi:unnamed protein product [Protopolystoma xenopodis]|uniref:Uncharacterized protein n=1 Tax=Protopolystoma xenopodis TaxID=117903 RepID=A0A448X7F3_9PLAT|nr:unnamed protein product [Protopolystoma xenopodis]
MGSCECEAFQLGREQCCRLAESKIDAIPPIAHAPILSAAGLSPIRLTFACKWLHTGHRWTLAADRCSAFWFSLRTFPNPQPHSLTHALFANSRRHLPLVSPTRPLHSSWPHSHFNNVAFPTRC